MTTTRPLRDRILTAVWAAILGVFIALFGQGVWSALIVANLATTPAIPWAVAVMAVVLWLIWQYLGGRWGPRRTSDGRRQRGGAAGGWAVDRCARRMVDADFPIRGDFRERAPRHVEVPVAHDDARSR